MKLLEKVWRDSGIKPPALANRPKLEPQDSYYLRVFHTLSSSREVGESVGAIPESEFEAYFNNRGVPPGEERDHTVAVVRRIDEEFLAVMAKRKKAAMERAERKRKVAK